MTEKPILMNTEMVQATLDGRKGQTRRIFKQLDTLKISDDATGSVLHAGFKSPCKGILSTSAGVYPNKECAHKHFSNKFAPYQVGDHLYVRETFMYDSDSIILGPHRCRYRASDEPFFTGAKWTPSIHMPKWAARIWLEVTNVRVERVQDISEDDAQAEGVRPNWSGNLDGWNAEEHGFLCQEAIKYTEEGREFADPYFCTAKEAFFSLWDSLATPETNWNANPWVFVYDFERIEK